MDYKILLFIAALVVSEVSYVTATYCSRNDDNDCESYKVTCSNGIDNLQRHCDNAFVTFELTNFNTNTFSADIFRSTSSNFDSTVRAIQGSNNSWTTLETSLFRYYSKTVKIDLSGNNIKYISDSTFNGLNLLESLNLSRNSIETISVHALLLSESRSAKLHTLDLSNNKISSIATGALQQLHELTYLNLENNRLSNLDGSSFGDMENLNYLSLRNNQITSLNNLLSHARSLNTLDLSQNYLTRLQGFEIIHIEALKIFNASWNAIETIDSNCFNQAFHLQTLDLSNNKITSSIESTMFITNTELEYLNLYNNSISEIQGSAFKNTKLSYLNLESNYLSGVVGEYTFAGLQSTQLNLSNYGIETIKNYAFSNSPNLVYLNLSHNIINTIEDHGIESLPALSILDLSYNSISNVNFLQSCCLNLTEIYLKDNKLESLPENILHEYMSIKVLDISMNNIALLGQNSLPLNNLQYFSVEGNLLGGVIQSGVFSPSKYMRTLDLSNMNFTAVHAGAFNDLPLLAKLNLSRNQITDIDPNNFIGLNNLFLLDVSYNQIKTLDINNAALKNVNSLYLNNNKLSSITGLVAHFTSLIFLDVSDNQIEDISNTQFDLSPNLQILYLSNNKIQSFNNQHTNKLKKLVDLKLSSNKLSNLNLSYFPQLESLEISNVGLKDINRQYLKNLKNLKYLDLSNNGIADFPPGIFHEINGIKYLNISSNNLVKLRFGSLNDLPRVELLDISRNNLNNLDVNLFHECTNLNQLIIDHNRITKLDVEALVEILPNLKTISLGGNAFSCAEVIQSLKTFNHSSVFVTSIQKVYHDDNIHGIKCGSESEIATTNKPTLNVITNAPTFEPVHKDIEHVTHPNIIHVESSHREYTALTAWCSILTILMLMIVFAFGYYYNRNLKRNSSETFDHRRASSIEMSGTEYNGDLLN